MSQRMKADGKHKSNVLPPRLRRSTEFRHVTSKGKRYRKDFLSTFISPTTEPDTGGRIGFIITDKAVKGAVHRNRVRRLLKEAARKWWRCIQPGYDIVLKANTAPRIDNGNYVEVLLVKLLLKNRILTKDGSNEASDFLSKEESA